MVASKIQALWNHPAGPKQWGINIANILNFSKPPETISYPQQTGTDIICARYSSVITPKNWNLLGVSVTMAATSSYQLLRKLRKDYYSDMHGLVGDE
ncbi:hypothetical protein QJS10_CPA10g01922 [Acorus calamus]|uniref:Mitochondrial pyruvate carrier n=1 Tax=Acorus calamus TaxID=4465 RepID=A0AAV9E0K1_ACOCL|nr:hypothetical protein QJS10_CPA10g01922 [Acorus calamus]